MGEDHSLRLGRGTGRENNFEWIGRLNLSAAKALGRMVRNSGRQIGGVDLYCLLRRLPIEERSPFARTQYQPGPHLRADPERKIGASRIVDGDRNYPTKRASQERRHPLGPVR